MRKALFAALLLPGLLTGTGAVAGEPARGLTHESKHGSATGYFSGALSYDTLLSALDTSRSQDSLSVGTFAFDLYKNDVGPLGLTLGGGYQLQGGGDVDPDGYSVGLRFDLGGFSVASQWRGRDEDACGLSESLCGAGPAWNIGASYSTGAASLSAQVQALNPLGAEGEGPGGEVYRLGLDYRIFDGISSHADAYFIDGDNGLLEGDSTMVLIGTRITF